MKELYISPEVELIDFVAEERLAGNVNWGDLDEAPNGGIQLGVNSTPGNPEMSQAGDIHLPFPKL